MNRPAMPSGPTGGAAPGMPGAASGPFGRSVSAPSADTYGTEPARPTVTVAAYPDYPSAQRVVDFLADNRFPVERTAIVGMDLTLVETVLGRLTTGRAALAGAATGAWFGLFIGLLFGLFTAGSWAAVIVVALVVGAAWGAIFGAVTHAMTGGRRDFTSASALRAGRYLVTVDVDVAERARELLTRLNWRPAGGT